MYNGINLRAICLDLFEVLLVFIRGLDQVSISIIARYLTFSECINGTLINFEHFESSDTFVCLIIRAAGKERSLTCILSFGP